MEKFHKLLIIENDDNISTKQWEEILSDAIQSILFDRNGNRRIYGVEIEEYSDTQRE